MIFQRAFLTGASSGIGRELALELARRGTRELVVTARRAELLATLQAELAELGATAHVEVLDVREPERAIECVQRWDEQLGGFDLVIANAGVGEARVVQDQVWAELDVVLQVNVRGAIATLFGALGPMLERNRGTLVGISSLASQRGLPGSGTYAASKAALTSWLETIGLDLAKTDIRVVDVRPGFVLTPMTEGAPFPKPFEISVSDAARRTLDGIEKGRAVVAYAWPMVWAMWWTRRLPDVVWRFLGRRVKPTA